MRYKKLFMVRIVRCWNRLPRKMMDASLETLKVALNILVWLKLAWLTAGRAGRHDL